MKEFCAAIQDALVGGSSGLVEMRLLARLVHALGEAVFSEASLVGRYAVDQPRVMGGDAQRNDLGCCKGGGAFAAESVPRHLCTGRRVIDLALKAGGVDPIFVLVLIERTCG